MTSWQKMTRVTLHYCSYGWVSYRFERMQYPWVPCSDIQIRRVDINKVKKVLWICLLTLISVSSCCSSVLASDDGLNTTGKRINQLGLAHFLSFRYFSIKIDKINWPIDFHRFSILIDKLVITIDFNRVSKISICYFLIMCKSKFIKIRSTVNPRQKYTICGQISLPRVTVSWKGTTLPINVKGVLGGGGAGRQGMVWGCDIFPKFVVKFPAHGQIIPVKCTKIS